MDPAGGTASKPRDSLPDLGIRLPSDTKVISGRSTFLCGRELPAQAAPRSVNNIARKKVFNPVKTSGKSSRETSASMRNEYGKFYSVHCRIRELPAQRSVSIRAKMRFTSSRSLV